jgi:MYXO-CTERM domain-containing protein
VGERFGFLAVDPTAGFEPHALPLPVRRDRLAPTLTCPAAVSATASEASGAAVTYAPAMASDNAGAPTLEYSHASGSTFPVGTTPVKVTATDAAGNRAECTFEVTVTRQDPGPAPQEEAEGCACTASGPGAGALWSLLALLAGVSVRRRRA